MKKIRLLVILSLVVGGTSLMTNPAITAGSFLSIFKKDDVRYAHQTEAPNESEYNGLVRKGVLARDRGELNQAIQYFEGAAEEPFAESPNYELWPDLTELYCSIGRKKEGRTLANEYSCAVDVMAGRKSCWVDGDKPFAVPNPKVSPLCYARICSTEYEGYYGQGNTNAKLRARDIHDRLIARKLQSVCSGM